MTIDLDKLLKLEAKATPSKWFAVTSLEYGDVPVPENGERLTDLDIQFTVAMRNSIKELCTELKAARELASLVKGYMRAMDEEHECTAYPIGTCRTCERIWTECSWSKEQIRNWLKLDGARHDT